MANRGLTATQLTEIAKSQVTLATLIKLETSTPVYMCNAHRDIVWGGNTYQALSHYVSIGRIQEDLNLSTGTISVKLSGVDQSFIAIFLGEVITNKKLHVYLGLLNTSGALIDDAINLFSGVIDSFTINESYSGGTCEITLTVANHWIDFEMVSGRRTNNDDQKVYYPNDLGFNHAAQIIKDLQWGKGA